MTQDLQTISFHPSSLKKEGLSAQAGVFSILIPSWNNLPYLQCCINSIRKNSVYKHEIIVHVNEGNDGTIAWLKEQNISFTHSRENMGVCFAFNAASALASSEYILLTDDDKYYCPGWDEPLLHEVQQLNHIYFCINGTSIEHTKTTNPCVIAPYNFGTGIEDFDEAKLLASYTSLPFRDWTGGNWYPMLLHKNIWTVIGGLSIEFSPGMGSDPDMMMKLWKAGVRYYKGVSSSRVYHFISKSVSRVRKNNGYLQFLRKWEMTSSTFFRYYLRLGNEFTGYTAEPKQTSALNRKLLKDKVKRAYSFFQNTRNT